jgi:hypothetical protein
MPLALAEVHDAGFPPSWRAGATSDGRGSNATFTPRVCDHALSSVNLADACQKNFFNPPMHKLNVFSRQAQTNHFWNLFFQCLLLG